MPAFGILAFVEAQPTEWPVEAWLRRTRFTAVVLLLTITLVIAVVLPQGGDRPGGMMIAIAGVWYWLPVLLRTGRNFAEGYQTGS